MSSRGVNKVILVGRLGQDPETRYTSSGQAVTNLTLATSESWKDRDSGEQKEITEWHRVVLFGKLAEVAGQHLVKGAQVYIEGQLKTRKWTDQAGVEKYTTEINVGMNGVMQMLGGRQTGGAPAGSSQRQAGNQSSAVQARQQQRSAPQSSEPPMDFDDSDIPF